MCRNSRQARQGFPNFKANLQTFHISVRKGGNKKVVDIDEKRIKNHIGVLLLFLRINEVKKVETALLNHNLLVDLFFHFIIR